MAAQEDVYCTLVLTDSYLPGAAVLAHSLRDGGTQKKLACLIAQDGLRDSTITELQSLYNYVIPIERLGNPHPTNLYLMNRPDLLYTFSKIHLWRLTEFRKIIYIDADVVALRAPDELFDLKETFAAAPDVGWPDAFNSGVMVISPHTGDYHALKTLASAGDSFDGGDQGLLNQYFEYKPWKRLSFRYNCTPSGHYQYEPAYRYYKRDISLVHFIGREKPWVRGRATQDSPTSYQELLSRWWAVYDRHFHVSTYDYVATGVRQPQPHAVQYEVQQSSFAREPAYYATGHPVETPTPAFVPEAYSSATNSPTTNPVDHTRGNVHASYNSPPVEEPPPPPPPPPFSAPHMQWDATQAAPPVQSHPEASNFPTVVYEFNNDPQPFKPPTVYPDPPRDMWYEVPKEKPRPLQKPQPIFPWEERAMPKPTRVFADEETPALETESASDESDIQLANVDEFEVTTDDVPEPVTPAITLNNSSIPWSDFGSLNKNAWDEVSGINSYVRALTAVHKNRGNVQVMSNNASQVTSPTLEPDEFDVINQARARRESLILTDFPSAVERPSLPVTPAPRRRETLWGTDDEPVAELPQAEGVPNQVDWDPSAQLEQLRRNSLLGPDDLKLPAKHKLPERSLPGTSVPLPHELNAALSSGPDSPLFTRSASDTDNHDITGTAARGNVPAAAATLAAAASDEAEVSSARAKVTSSEFLNAEPDLAWPAQ